MVRAMVQVVLCNPHIIDHTQTNTHTTYLLKPTKCSNRIYKICLIAINVQIKSTNFSTIINVYHLYRCTLNNDKYFYF